MLLCSLFIDRNSLFVGRGVFVYTFMTQSYLHRVLVTTENRGPVFVPKNWFVWSEYLTIS